MTPDQWLTLISIIVTAALGVAAGVIAYQQYKLNKNLSYEQTRLASEQLKLSDIKLKFDLYLKRLALFMILRDFASQIAMGDEEYDAGKFYRDTIERYFLFDANEYDYFDKVYQKANELTHALLDRSNLPEEAERQEASQRVASLKTWFNNQSDEMIKVFSNCLSVKTLKQPDSLDMKISNRRLPN